MEGKKMKWVTTGLLTAGMILGGADKSEAPTHRIPKQKLLGPASVGRLSPLNNQEWNIIASGEERILREADTEILTERLLEVERYLSEFIKEQKVEDSKKYNSKEFLDHLTTARAHIMTGRYRRAADALAKAIVRAPCDKNGCPDEKITFALKEPMWALIQHLGVETLSAQAR